MKTKQKTFDVTSSTTATEFLNNIDAKSGAELLNTITNFIEFGREYAFECLSILRELEKSNDELTSRLMAAHEKDLESLINLRDTETDFDKMQYYASMVLDIKREMREIKSENTEHKERMFEIAMKHGMPFFTKVVELISICVKAKKQ